MQLKYNIQYAIDIRIMARDIVEYATLALYATEDNKQRWFDKMVKEVNKLSFEQAVAEQDLSNQEIFENQFWSEASD